MQVHYSGIIADLSGVKLSTEVTFSQLEKKPNYDSEILLMGSCFSENIGAWMRQVQFKSVANPGGIIYNPISLAGHIEMALDGGWAIEENMQSSQGIFVHTDFHSSFAQANKGEAVEALRTAMKHTETALLKVEHLFITFGTSVVFSNKETGRVVNNCHKLPAAHFEKSMASVASMVEAMGSAIRKLQETNPAVHICLTVSPVRHLRHGAIENQRSKARLVLLCEQLCAEFAQTTYLPVYEYAMDELRDYRYYRHDDLIHLGDAGLALLKERLENCLFDSETLAKLQKVKQWLQMKNHRLLHPETKDAQEFLRKLAATEQALQTLLNRPLNGFNQMH